VCGAKTIIRMNGGCHAIFVNFIDNSTKANYSDLQTTLSTVLSDGVDNSRFSCSSLASNQEVMPTASKTKNFSLFLKKRAKNRALGNSTE